MIPTSRANCCNFRGDVELFHEDEEDKQVVDRQAVLGQPHCEELSPCGMAL